MRKKILTTLIVFITIVIAFIPKFVLAETDFGLGDLDNYRGTNTDSAELTSMVGNILGIIRAIGTVISVVMLIGIGIKYLLGSIEEKADYKKSLIPYVIGAAVLFTGTMIPQIIYNLVEQM